MKTHRCLSSCSVYSPQTCCFLARFNHNYCHPIKIFGLQWTRESVFDYQELNFVLLYEIFVIILLNKSCQHTHSVDHFLYSFFLLLKYEYFLISHRHVHGMWLTLINGSPRELNNIFYHDSKILQFVVQIIFYFKGLRGVRGPRSESGEKVS